MLTPQLDLYQNIRDFIVDKRNLHGLRILDYGCGNGFGTIQLCASNRGVVGVDSDPDVVNFAKTTMGHLAKFSLSDLSDPSALPLGGVYDVVTCIEVIEHVENVKTLMRNLKSVGGVDAVYFFSTLNHNSQYRKNAGHVGKWHVQDFKSLMETFFSEVSIVDYTLKEKICKDSSITPMVAMCEA
jgi:2-polyprenyl-3-methyl-5-hydroxy-6-metoxy-1,4-benzoquinol methylase